MPIHPPAPVILWWTDTAVAQYKKYLTDQQVKVAFDGLVDFITELPNGPTRGELVTDLLVPLDQWHDRVGRALSRVPLGSKSRVVITEVPPPPHPNPPPVLAVAVHVKGAPNGTGANHTLLLLAVIPRQRNVGHR